MFKMQVLWMCDRLIFYPWGQNKCGKRIDQIIMVRCIMMCIELTDSVMFCCRIIQALREEPTKLATMDGSVTQNVDSSDQYGKLTFSFTHAVHLFSNC